MSTNVNNMFGCLSYKRVSLNAQVMREVDSKVRIHKLVAFSHHDYFQRPQKGSAKFPRTFCLLVMHKFW